MLNISDLLAYKNLFSRYKNQNAQNNKGTIKYKDKFDVFNPPLDDNFSAKETEIIFENCQWKNNLEKILIIK